MGLDQVLLLGSVVLLASIGAARIGARFGLPSLLLFLGLGVLVAELGLSSTTPTWPTPSASPRWS